MLVTWLGWQVEGASGAVAEPPGPGRDQLAGVGGEREVSQRLCPASLLCSGDPGLTQTPGNMGSFCPEGLGPFLGTLFQTAPPQRTPICTSLAWTQPSTCVTGPGGLGDKAWKIRPKTGCGAGGRGPRTLYRFPSAMWLPVLTGSLASVHAGIPAEPPRDQSHQYRA